MSDKQIVIDLEHIDALAKEGGKLIFKKAAEVAILRLLQMQTYLEDRLNEIKLSIVKSGAYLDPKFKGVVGENIKAMYRSYGKKYEYKGDPERVPPDTLPFVKIVQRIEIDSKAVDKHLKETGNLPGAISLVEDRKPILSLSIIKNAEDFNEVTLLPKEELPEKAASVDEIPL